MPLSPCFPSPPGGDCSRYGRGVWLAACLWLVGGGMDAAAAVARPEAVSPPQAPVHEPALQVPKTVRPLLEVWMRDTYIVSAADGAYYLTGTTAAPGRNHCWDWNDGIRLWRSRDLQHWEALGLVWSLEREDIWQGHAVEVPAGHYSASGEPLEQKRRAVWSPRLHYLQRLRQWVLLAYLNNGKGAFLLRSTSGRPEGPYENAAGNVQGPLCYETDGDLFEDDDGAVYFVGSGHKIARLREDLSGLAEPLRALQETPFDPEPHAEGVSIVKHEGKYHLVQSYWSFRKPDGKYSYLGPHYQHPSRHSCDVVVAVAERVYGPYGPRYTALVEGGHGNVFRDRAGRWWATMFGNPRGASAAAASFLSRPALVPLKYENGRFAPDPTR